MKATEALNKLEREGRVVLLEPCNCGDRILHNNGGNYHEVVTFELRKDGYFGQFDITCELTPDEPFQAMTYDEIEQFIQDHLDWL